MESRDKNIMLLDLLAFPSDVAPPWSFSDPDMLYVFDAYADIMRHLVGLIQVDETDQCRVMLMGTIRDTTL